MTTNELPMLETNEKRQAIPNSIGRVAFAALSVLLQVLWIYGLVARLTEYSVFLQLLVSLLALGLVFKIYGDPINSAYKTSWIILILLFPILGACLYLIFGRTEATRRLRKNIERSDAVLEPTFSEMKCDQTALDALRAEDAGLANQAAYLQNWMYSPLWQNTEVTFYADTCEALEAQKEALRKAEHFIFMEYHAIEASTAWQGIEDILAERAAAGVDVRVFYDDIGSIGFVSPKFVRRLEARGIQCRMFNPVLPILSVVMNNRDHRKITVVDGQVGFTGGYNLADEYFNLTHPYGQWKDSGVRLVGDAVQSLTMIFLEMWGAMQDHPEDPRPYLPPVHTPSAPQGYVLPYADSPMDHERVGENVYINLIENAKRYVWITTPYLILSDEMQRALTRAVKRGVDVRIVTPGIPDKKLIFRVTRSYYAGLASYGVRIFEYTPGFLHAKQVLADDEVAVVGTINFDFRSLYLHFENACWFCRCDAVRDVRKDFEDLFEISHEVTTQYGTHRNAALRGLDCLLRMFSPLM